MATARYTAPAEDDLKQITTFIANVIHDARDQTKLV
jgi:hypothetical protein